MSFTFPRVLFFFLRRKMCSKWPGEEGSSKKNTHKNDIQREKPLPPQACSCIVTAKRGKEEQRKKKLSKDLMHIEKKGENKTKPLSHTLHQKLSQISRTPRHPHTNTTRARKGELTSQRNVLIVCLLTGAEGLFTPSQQEQPLQHSCDAEAHQKRHRFPAQRVVPMSPCWFERHCSKFDQLYRE